MKSVCQTDFHKHMTMSRLATYCLLNFYVPFVFAIVLITHTNTTLIINELVYMCRCCNGREKIWRKWYLYECSCRRDLQGSAFRVMQIHASDYHPLPDTVVVTMLCLKISQNTTQDNPLQNCTVFLEYPVTLAMSEAPTMRFTFKCRRLIEDRQPRQDTNVASMVQ